MANLGTAYVFQPTPLMRGATAWIASALEGLSFQPTPRPSDPLRPGLLRRVSTHAPPARGDRWGTPRAPSSSGFNPRPSGAGRRHLARVAPRRLLVSTHAPPARGDASM